MTEYVVQREKVRDSRREEEHVQGIKTKVNSGARIDLKKNLRKMKQSYMLIYKKYN